ncbi:tape-measure protein [Streptomyces sp. NPDC048604]|uniref:tape-measure protein n=1 Tax=Streptomyces sp. NPDC048604 TaxID=3365578 RepID=UPI003722FF66
MSTAAIGATLDPLAGLAQALRDFRGTAGQVGRALRSVGGGVKQAAGAVGRVKAGAGGAAPAVRQAKERASAADRSLAKAGRDAGTAAGGLRTGAARTRTSGRALGELVSFAGEFVSVTDLLGKAGLGVAALLGPLGGALTVAAGAMTAVNVAMRANPLGFVLGLLVPVIGYLLEPALNSETGQRIMKQVFDQVLKVFVTIGKFLGPVVRAYGSVVSASFQAVLTVVTGVVRGIGAVVDRGFPAVRDGVTAPGRALGGIVRRSWDGLRNAVKPVLDWLTRRIPEGFTRVRNATGDTLRGMGEFVRTGLQAVVGVMKAPLEGLIAFANWVIDGLNSLSFSFFGKKFGVNIPKIPMLAEGGVVTPSGTRPGAIVPLGSVPELRAAEPGRHTRPAPRRIVVDTFRERPGSTAHGVAEDLLFLARAS